MIFTMKNPRIFSIPCVYASYSSNSNGQRLGQFIYNYFREKFPDTKIPDEVDCFDNDDLISDFLAFALLCNSQSC